jgi:hypothetical protein
MKLLRRRLAWPNAVSPLAGRELAEQVMKDLPPDLGALDDDDLMLQRATRDARIAALFRTWPQLAGRELKELRRLYDERLRLARHLGRLRRGPG